jgi:nucleotide-binding universal stress UspA family protein
MRYRSNNILALVPPCEEGAAVLKQVLFFQQALGMHIFVYQIIEKPSLFEKLFHAKRAKNTKLDSLNRLREFTETTIPARAKKHFTYRVKYGNTLPVLLRQSKKGGYEFIIVNKSGASCSMDPSDIDKLISKAYCPVMVVNKDHLVAEISKIIIPVDVLKSTPKKLLWATYFAKKYKAKVIIVSALTINIEKKQSLAWRNAEKLKHILVQRGIQCEVSIIKAPGAEKHAVILDFIRNEKPGMIILRTHQDSGNYNTQIGGFVSKLIHESEVPVFTVNLAVYPMPVDFEE